MLFKGIGLVEKNRNYMVEFKSLKWVQGFYKFQLYKEILYHEPKKSDNTSN